MAQVKFNNFTKGISGKIGGDMLFKTWNNKTFVCKMPVKPTKESPLQKENRTKFKMATAYAKAMMLDPGRKEKYRKMARKQKLPNAYTAAITEYMRKKESPASNQQLNPLYENFTNLTGHGAKPLSLGTNLENFQRHNPADIASKGILVLLEEAGLWQGILPLGKIEAG